MENAMGKSKETGLVVEYQPQKWEIPFCPVSWFHFSDWLAESIVTSMNFADILDFNSAVTRRTIMKCEIGNCNINDDIFYSINTYNEDEKNYTNTFSEKPSEELQDQF